MIQSDLGYGWLWLFSIALRLPGVVENSLKTKLEKCSISMVVVAV
jgi:hypothetical protein